MFECVELHWTEYFKAVGPTLIAGFIAYIAYQQWQVNVASLREKLFNRRMEIFDYSQNLRITVFAQNAKNRNQGFSKEMDDKLNVCSFLFDEEVFNWLSRVTKHVIEYDIARDEKLSFDGVENLDLKHKKRRDDALKKMKYERQELNVLFGERRSIFRKYLDFSKLR